MRIHRVRSRSLLLVSLGLLPVTARAQNLDTVQVTSQKLSDCSQCSFVWHR